MANNADSLKQALAKTHDLSTQALLCSEIAKSLEHENLDSAFHYAGMGFELGQQAGNVAGMAENAAVLGDLYVIDNQLEKAKERYLLAGKLFRDLGQTSDYCQTLVVLGNIFLTQDMYFEAHQKYLEVLDISLEHNYTAFLPHVYNNIGVIFLNLNDSEEALPYFEKALSLFKEQGDQYNVAYISANPATIYVEKGEGEKALDLYMEMLPVFLKLQDWSSLADTYDRIANYYFSKENLEKAKEQILLAHGILENNNNTFSGPSSIIKARVLTSLAKINFQEKNLQEALGFAKAAFDLRTANFLQEDIATTSLLLSEIFEELGQIDSALHFSRLYVTYSRGLEKAKSLKNVNQQKLQHEFAMKLQQAEMEQLRVEAAHRQREYLYIGLLIFSLLFALILVLLYRYQRNKTLNANLRKENLELEKAKLNQEILYKNKELTTNMMYLFEKNEFITHIARKLDEIKPEAKRENKVQIQQIINELKKNSSQSAWEEFEIRFMEVHADFYENLNKTFPDLTPNEKRLCAFLRLNMTTKEISSITHQSVQSINMARFRLRKKMDMERDENLISFLNKL